MHQFTKIGAGIGAIAGGVYYYLWGCTGSCFITSSPYLTVIWGAMMGGLLFSSIQDFRKSNSNTTTET